MGFTVLAEVNRC